MASSKRGLRFGRRAVDFVGEDHVREDGAAAEDEFATFRAVFEDFGAGDVGGHQIGRELDALEAQVADIGDGFDEQRLREARCAGDEAMTAAEQGDEHFINDMLLADDDLSDLHKEALACGGEQFDDLAFGEGFGRRRKVGRGAHEDVVDYQTAARVPSFHPRSDCLRLMVSVETRGHLRFNRRNKLEHNSFHDVSR
jgi:hypothetical protein